MRHSLSLFLSVLAIACIASCAPETQVQPEKNLSVTLKETSVTLPFETEVKVDYNYADAEGTLVVDSKNLPEGISFTNKVTSLSEGSISFFSRMDFDKEYKVSLIFGDRNKSITKDITLKTLKKETPFSIDIESSEISLVYNEDYKLEYTAISPKEKAFASVFLSELNHGHFDAKAFATALCHEHPTIQQMFFRLVKTCLKVRAEEHAYSNDERNSGSVRMCQELAQVIDKYPLPIK